MQSILLSSVFLTLAGLSSASAGEPIPGVDVIVRKCPGSCPGGSIVVHTQTGTHGSFEFKMLEPGRYEIDIDGRSLAAAMNGVHKSPSEMKRVDAVTPQAAVRGDMRGTARHTNAGEVVVTVRGRKTAVSKPFALDRENYTKGLAVFFDVPSGPAIYSTTISDVE